MTARRALVLALTLTAATGCRKESTSSETGGAKAGTAAPSDAPAADTHYRAVLAGGDGIEIPFRLFVPAEGSDKKVSVEGGEGVIEPTTTRTGDELVLSFDLYHTRIEAERQADGRLKGKWVSSSPTWGDGTLKFSAAPAEPAAPLFAGAGEAAAAAQAIGTWKVKLAESGDAKLVVREGRGSQLGARIEFTTGNIVSLAGTAAGGKLQLSGFDGSSPYLLTVSIDKDEAGGQWVAGPALAWQEKLTATRGEDFKLDHQVALADRPKLDYEQIKAGKYKGKPMILELAGSWCSTCSRAAPFLAELYEEHGPEGLQMLTLVYEFTEDSDYNRQQAVKFKEKYEIPWEVTAIDGTLDDYWDILPSALTDVNPAGFPVALFVAADGTVAGVHAGFPTDTKGPAYEAVTGRYRSLVATIMKAK